MRASKADEAALEGTIDDLEHDLADAEADEADLAAHLRGLQSSQAQFEHYRDNDGEYRWRLRHENGNVIADSNQSTVERRQYLVEGLFDPRATYR